MVQELEHRKKVSSSSGACVHICCLCSHGAGLSYVKLPVLYPPLPPSGHLAPLPASLAGSIAKAILVQSPEVSIKCLLLISCHTRDKGGCSVGFHSRDKKEIEGEEIKV
ncbi:hypothetical protein LDENG_00168400 [Lucifuga dentata]|nr:hypothetical protein LDENG_00168400 [Lucifuga dentata]